MFTQPNMSSKRRWWGLLFICVALLVTSLDSTALYLALPNIALDFRTSATELQWIVNVFALVFGSLLLTMGNVGDRFGRKKAWFVGLIIFALGALIAGVSRSTEVLIGARGIVGFASALMMPASLSIVIATFTNVRERAQAIAILMATFGLGVGLGPLVGGWIMGVLDWQAVFFVNLPLIAISLAGGVMFIDESRKEEATLIDIPGAVLSIIGFFALLYAITEVGWNGWTAPNVVRGFAVSGTVMGIFFWWENRTPYPMLPMKFFKNRVFFGANTGLALVAFSLFGSIFFISQYFQSVRGYEPLEAGIALLPIAAIVMVVSLVSAKINEWLGERITISSGILLAAIGLYYLAGVAAVDTPLSDIYFGTSILAVGLGLAMSPATATIMDTIPQSQLGVGAAITDTTRQLGGALGIALLGSLMSATYLQEVAVLETMPLMNLIPEQMMLGIQSNIQVAHFIADTLRLPVISAQIIETADAAFVIGMAEAMRVATGILVATAILTFFTLPGRIPQFPTPTETGEVFPVAS